ncbi:hypothetical protein ST201phi2-1p377 [Pseudomonas phage 201phi2-1]|uniref:Uncharacterized protein n=1 Tax=Pseudomonas phage 201phi2-1 TaxID=198110 RepID=B3FJN7_BP201|nr:hypothetical protein ST201phi2-1p377 [Pseudomonas phage 201phi2-1]ABY63202.1 hypothetical protein 201phi2-1p377 [Pseudomonas phage 201phi2-1]
MSEANAVEQEETYATGTQVVLAELNKLPEKILGYAILDNAAPDVKLIQEAIRRTLGIVETHMDLSYPDSDLVPQGEGPDVQLTKVEVHVPVTDLATKYWDMVNG